jgi:hypothetical protein
MASALLGNVDPTRSPQITVGGYPVRIKNDSLSRAPVNTYTQQDFERIAAAVGKDVADAMTHQKDFENAAFMFKLDRGFPAEFVRSRGSTPTQLRRKIERVEKSARRLLEDLGVPRDGHGHVKIEEAYDGPGDLEILKVLSWAVQHDEDPVITATRRLGKLAEILEAIAATGDLEQWGRHGLDEVVKFGRLTVPKGHQGDLAVNGWIAAVLPLYKQISGNDPGTSVGGPETDHEGIAGGPLVRFLEAVGRPLGITYSSDAWRSRIRGILDHQQN